MARGQQKIQSQQKNQKKMEQQRKAGNDQKAAAMKALVHTCAVCKSQMPDPKTYKQHFESKHPKAPMPPELVEVQAKPRRQVDIPRRPVNSNDAVEH